MKSPSREKAAEMFDRIAGRYDVLNRILSFGLDVSWRRKFVKMMPEREELRVLDLATGTADVLIEILRQREVSVAVGVDPSVEMMEIGWEKLKRHGIDQAVLAKGEAEHLTFVDDSFDVVTMAFGIRNAKSVSAALKEMHRVLAPGGTVLVLEFSMPTFSLIKPFHKFYLRHILPTIGGLISGEKSAYVYLNKTIETFPSGQAFLDLMKEAGFTETKTTPLNFGIVSIYSGKK